MADGLLAQGPGFLAGQLRGATAAAGVALSYQPAAGGAPTDLTGLAWGGTNRPTRRDPVATRGPAVEAQERDFLVPVSALAAEPRLGDRVTETAGGWAEVYEVVTPAGEPAWRYSDPLTKSVYRLHTKRVSRSPA